MKKNRVIVFSILLVAVFAIGLSVGTAIPALSGDTGENLNKGIFSVYSTTANLGNGELTQGQENEEENIPVLMSEPYGDNLIRHYAVDSQGNFYKVLQIETGIIYDEVVDVIPCRYTYEVTDIMIEKADEPYEDDEKDEPPIEPIGEVVISLITEPYGEKFVRHYAIDNFGRYYYIRQIETGAVYSETVDLIPCIYTYEPTDIMIEETEW